MKKNDERKIAVVSDIHYAAPALFSANGQHGKAFNNYVAKDPKLIAYSDHIWRRVLADLRADKPDILLVPGDLTKDGERVSHEAMAGFFKCLLDDGIKVFVIPGNHDVANPEAVRYDGAKAYPTPTISAAEFSQLYAGFGYADAISRDPESLSYIAKADSDLWILGIDSCRYEDNAETSTAAGRIKPETLHWILERLSEADKQTITVFAMMHHNLLEHYTNQSVLDPGYVIDDWQSISETLMDAGLRIIFTGHYHANNITRYQNGEKELYDIETGSLVTAPVPYRRIIMKNKELHISTNQVNTIEASLPHNLSFPQYARQFLSGHLDNYFKYFLANPPFSASTTLAAFAAPLFRQGIMAHFAGDAKMNLQQREEITQLANYSPGLADILGVLWKVQPVNDNKEKVRYRE